ncbi:MAG TPA: aldehyde dehydrogenase family protein [Kofleriaceae bacterium]|nr:aldehyde dehydrogenase family protein [Kofleriaceae bacterium]
MTERHDRTGADPRPLGDFIDGRFEPPEGEPLISVNPARGGARVLETAASVARVARACDAAAAAAPAWARLSLAARADHLARFRAALAERADQLAEAITLETGKLRSEARAEVGSLVARFDLVRRRVEEDVCDRAVPGRPAERLRHHPLGVVGVIGPFNFPLHLCHAHVVPALLCGNAVVIKPSEVTPLAAQRYAEAAAAAGLPPGVFNLVQGGGPSGAALVDHPAVRGVCFTGSYRIGRRLAERCLDRPEVLLALEMGGKNTVVVLEDADVYQAAHEIALGAYLTTGQRCTATERVLVSRERAPALVAALRTLVPALRFGDPDDPRSFAGPMTTAAGRERVLAALERARAAGAEPVVGGEPAGGEDRFYLRPSLHLLPDGVHEVPGYSDEELFGPDLSVEAVDGDDEAIAVLRASRYGLATSVFTADDERFERFYRECHSGIVNRNRSTNLASPLLPFGGVGRSGNYRPAGSHAPRNVVYPVAVQENVLGWGQVHPQLAELMPEPDLDRLEAQHAREEAAEASRNLLDQPRPREIRLPPGGALPRSAGWLRRLYAGDRVVEEKKPPVVDHLRSSGPYLVSVDDEPLSVLDGMSQTATMVGGFAESHVVQAYFEGRFGDTLVATRDTALEPPGASCEAEELATALRQMVPGLPHVTFTNSGAEANEKALALCRLNAANPQARGVLAFEGGFHGRTLLTLHASWNPSKRAPFELPGYEVTFAPFPVWRTPMAEEPPAPSGFYAAAGTGDVDTLASRFGDADDDPLLAAEVASLVAVHRVLARGETFAVIVEPMQAEGGDRYATARFFRALRLLTRHHQVSLIFDEVQTGLALGGSFAWHEDFRLVNFRGRPDYPDAVTFAKRAQVGVCMSRFEDPELTSAHPASLIRGRIHADMMFTEHSAERVEKLVTRRLAQLAQGFPHLVGDPRAKGFALAFDLPSPEHLAAYLGQRFWRGVVCFGAGDRTVRYRLSESYLSREVDLLFERIRRSLAWLDAHPGATPPAWEDSSEVPPPREGPPPHRIRHVSAAEAERLLPIMLDIEHRVYEPARRTPPEDIRNAIRDPEAIVTIAEVGLDDGAWRFAGFAIGYPLEQAAQIEEGPDRDPMLGKHNTLYSLSLTVAPEYQGSGLGRLIKLAQLREAARWRRESGAARYRYVTGRNRIGHTPRMTHLNWVYGAHLVSILTGQYEDPEGQAIYYRIPLAPLAPGQGGSAGAGTPAGAATGAEAPAAAGAEAPAAPAATAAAVIDCAQGIARPLATPPASLLEAQAQGLLYGPAINKITLMNYVTPAVVRAIEWVTSLCPRLPHLYLTSSRDETVDKSIRILRWHRKRAAVVIGLEGGYVGHTTAAARSISDPAVHRQGPPHFDWPRVPHPAEVGSAACADALRAAVAAAGGPDAVLGLYLEVVQERTGRVIPDDFWPELERLRGELDLPVVAVETASACYRSGRGPFGHTGAPTTPDLLLWWGGGQTGYIHVASRFRVARPLMMVSTWDGDELSLVREHHQLRAARHIDVAAASRALDAALAPAAAAGLPASGLGAYRVIRAGERAEAIAAGLLARGVRVRPLPGGALAIAPGLDQAEEAAAALARALPEVVS